MCLCETSDGVLRYRRRTSQSEGPATFFGERQHGLPELKIANLAGDMSVLRDATLAASAVMQDDPKLEKKSKRRIEGTGDIAVRIPECGAQIKISAAVFSNRKEPY